MCTRNVHPPLGAMRRVGRWTPRSSSVYLASSSLWYRTTTAMVGEKRVCRYVTVSPCRPSGQPTGGGLFILHKPQTTGLRHRVQESSIIYVIGPVFGVRRLASFCQSGRAHASCRQNITLSFCDPSLFGRPPAFLLFCCGS
jgi:hypothetical protein